MVMGSWRGMGGSETARQRKQRSPMMSLSSDGDEAELGISLEGLALADGRDGARGKGYCRTSKERAWLCWRREREGDAQQEGAPGRVLAC